MALCGRHGNKLARNIWTKSWRIPCETRLQKGERRDISIKYGDIALEPSLTLKIDICEDCTRDKSQKKLLVFLCHCIDALDTRKNWDRQVAPSCWDFEKQPRSMYPLPRPLSHSSEGTPKVVTYVFLFPTNPAQQNILKTIRSLHQKRKLGAGRRTQNVAIKQFGDIMDGVVHGPQLQRIIITTIIENRQSPSRHSRGWSTVLYSCCK